MKKLMLILTVLFVGMSANSAFALNLCVTDSIGHDLKFDNVKLPKGKSAPLAGRLNIGGSETNAPLSGVVTVDSDNVTTRIVVEVVHVANGELVRFYLTGDKAFNASGRFDGLPFNFGGDGNYSWANVPCNTLLPAFRIGSPAGGDRIIPE
jgi:hypothetical protein